MKVLHYSRIVLVEPTHPGNIGAVARIMANLGSHDLALVKPRQFPSSVALVRAAGADEILNTARLCETLDEAIADCSLVIGTTARRRSIVWPVMLPADAMKMAVESGKDSKTAIIFGRESSGLTNQELDRCNFMVRIDVEDDFASVNLASAVTVMLYELRKQASSKCAQPLDLAALDLAQAEQTNGLFRHLEEVLHYLEFIDGRSATLMRKLTRLFNRARLTYEEVNILRGILSAIQFKAGKLEKAAASDESSH